MIEDLKEYNKALVTMKSSLYKIEVLLKTQNGKTIEAIEVIRKKLLDDLCDYENKIEKLENYLYNYVVEMQLHLKANNKQKQMLVNEGDIISRISNIHNYITEFNDNLRSKYSYQNKSVIDASITLDLNVKNKSKLDTIDTRLIKLKDSLLVDYNKMENIIKKQIVLAIDIDKIHAKKLNKDLK